MKKLYLVVISFVIVLTAIGQKAKKTKEGKEKAPKMSAAQKATEDKVTKIKKVFFDINASKLKSQAFEYANKCGVKKATVTLYYKGSDVVKATDMGTGDGRQAAANWIYQYYYDKGKLIFAYQQVTAAANARPIETKRYYTANKLVRRIDDNKVTDNTKETIDNTAPEYLIRSVKTAGDIGKVHKCG